MKIVKQISSLEKIRMDETPSSEEVFRKTCLKGERFSYQISVRSDEILYGKITVDSPISENARVYNVLNAVMDLPVSDDRAMDDPNFITKTPGLMPDILKPIEEQQNIIIAWKKTLSLWIDVAIPSDIDAGNYGIEVRYNDTETGELIYSKIFVVEVIKKEILPQSLIYTRWFYADCIADYHRTDVYSEEHWHLIEQYIKQAVYRRKHLQTVPWQCRLTE